MNGSANALTGGAILREREREREKGCEEGVNSRSAKTVAINALGEIFYTLFDYLYELPI